MCTHVRAWVCVCVCDIQFQVWIINTVGTGHNFSIQQSQADGGPLGIPALPTLQVKSAVQVRQATSGSSREDSDDDDLEGDMETTDNMDPSDEKRARR